MDNLSHREELIEKYISGEMSTQELRTFENEMDANPGLKEEVSFQKDIITALRMEREAALKARLDNVKVPSPYATYLTAGITSAVIIGGVFLLSTLWPVEFNEELAQNENRIENNADQALTESSEIIQDEKELNEEAELEISSPNPKSESVKDISEDRVNNTADSKSDEVIAEKTNTDKPLPKIVTPQAPEPAAESGFTTSGLENSANEIINNEKRETSKVEVEIKSSKDFNFHYQYFNNKLFLYGDFSKSPYELIELNSADSKTLYMYFSGRYFALNSNQMEVSKLTPLRDKIIIKGLDNLRLR